MKLSISSVAENDIERIGDYIAKDSPRRAVNFINALYKQCEKNCAISIALSFAP